MTRCPAPALLGESEGQGSLSQNFLFYIGLHQPSDARHFERCCIHIGRLETRQKPLGCGKLLIDSQAFMKLKLHGCYPDPPEAYAAKVNRAAQFCADVSAVTEDYMCEPFVLARTGLTTADHQRLTIERYDAIRAALDAGIYLMPVLQGFAPHEYVDHLRQYGERLPLPAKDEPGMWVGVGSVCKRNGDPSTIRDVLYCIKKARPDLRLHGFGIKTTALDWHGGALRAMLHSADSLAWSYHARKNGRNANSWHEADAFDRRIGGDLSDLPMFKEMRL